MPVSRGPKVSESLPRTLHRAAILLFYYFLCLAPESVLPEEIIPLVLKLWPADSNLWRVALVSSFSLARQRSTARSRASLFFGTGAEVNRTEENETESVDLQLRVPRISLQRVASRFPWRVEEKRKGDFFGDNNSRRQEERVVIEKEASGSYLHEESLFPPVLKI